MAKGVYRLTVTREISSSHCLRNYQGACERLHGHNFTIEAVVEGRTLTPDTELLFDFKEFKATLDEVIAPLDHQHLNDLPYFATRNPSAENVARYVWTHLLPRLTAMCPTVELKEVSVSEKDSSKATYFELDD